MSKFFNWLKKDKKPQESVEQEIDPKNSDNEQANETQNELKNNNSEKDKILSKANENVDSSQNIASDSALHSETKIDENSNLETSHSYIETSHSIDSSEQKTVDNNALEPSMESEENLTPESKLVTEETEKDTVEQIVESEPVKKEAEKPEKTGFFGKLKRSLSRTKESIGSGIIGLFRGKAIDDELFEELETQLLVADLGMNTTVKLIDQLTETSNRKQLKDGEALYQILKEQMSNILSKVESPLTLSSPNGPFVILMVGVNGVGKTTTIGKMAKQFQQQGKKVMLAAGDTFRAAAVEQLQVWGERNDIPVVAQQTGSDSASVIFDAFQSAQAKNIDVLIADTAGRLQNKDHLMEELKKVVRVMKKISPEAPHEIMLTLDASTGQNAVSQTKLFHEAVGLTGISLTKLDGTAKGGVIFSIADEFEIPIRYIGIGEGIDDLRPFNSQDFVNALFTEPEGQSEQVS
ncbi:signal recognition particle-docking protein FtsY [Paraglaciecola sp.]|uniref:signal recognition particle-docking protein FtsY n=1 Tax=Paraglaciecola sp. TaxID=1920173 RepID=UPI003EFB2245